MQCHIMLRTPRYSGAQWSPVPRYGAAPFFTPNPSKRAADPHLASPSALRSTCTRQKCESSFVRVTDSSLQSSSADQIFRGGFVAMVLLPLVHEGVLRREHLLVTIRLGGLVFCAERVMTSQKRLPCKSRPLSSIRAPE